MKSIDKMQNTFTGVILEALKPKGNDKLPESQL